ncbi:MAG TPA: FAD-dependent oxidoreductase, partial [Anaerolineae bacterium]|nr:FAD-dependent oxidoreductase [Anaerolineae bacterium]
MSNSMKALPFEALLNWILSELERQQSIFGIHRSLFHVPRPGAPYATCDLYGQELATPIGPAAGPHTQLAQNIVCAWLAGGRFIELKTVQIMDELELARPCIDMEDEGYNVEWSQELKLEQSAQEYIKAWALIHILHHLLGFAGRAPVGTIFNMSVGYNLEGIQSTPMTRFMDRLADASAELAEIGALLCARFPQFAAIEIPTRLTNNVTLSTMHGCPPDEIERIARYLIEERGLHTTVKLNPTLLGKDTVLHILHDRLGYREIQIPDRVFEHDLQYPRAVALIKSLQSAAAGCGLAFGVKLSNTLAMANVKGALPGGEMYMSGRALYPVTINLFHKLAREFGGSLNVSYSAGADALNVATILACGARPVTVASDLLKPGGYARLAQYLENLETAMQAQGATSLDELARDRLANLERAAAEALEDPRYQKAYFPYGLPKVASRLELFDCITAPCTQQCAVCQDVPEYAWSIAHGACDEALDTILRRNPLPGVTGYICTHLCQTRCTRNNYDQPVAIRDLKRFAFEHGHAAPVPARPSGRRVVVIGSGPAGLSAAYFLALSGVEVTVHEAQERPGGMPAIAPHFRLPSRVLQADIDRITGLGVDLRLSSPVTVPPQALLSDGFDAVYIACGFQNDAALDIDGGDAPGVWGALHFLRQIARGQAPQLGPRVLVIGGGNTAIDAARTAQRLTGRPVTIVYRRTRAEMPAAREELL